MDAEFSNKISALTKGKNKMEALTILHTVAFFPPGEVRSGIFSLLVSDRNRRRTVIEILQRQSLVRMNSKGNSFFVSETTQEKIKQYLESKHLTEVALNVAITHLKEVKTLGDYPCFLSVYNHAKLYPKLLENIDALPGNIVFGMNQSGKLEEAVNFGEECKEFLIENLGKYHGAVLHLESAIGSTLLKLQKVDAAVKVLTAAYHKASVTLKVQFDTYAYMKLLAKALLKDNPLGSLRAEDSLREKVFYKKSPSESWSHSELEKWTQYALIIKRYDLASAAISILDNVCKQRLQIFGPNDDNICDAKVIKAECLSLESRFFEALDILRKVNDERSHKFGEGHWGLLRVRYDIAKVLKKMKCLEASIDTLQYNVIMAKKIAGERHILFLKSMLQISKISMLEGNFEKALNVSSELYDKLVRFFGVAHSMCYETAMIIGESLLQLNDPKKASEVFEEIQENFENFDIEEKYIPKLNPVMLQISKVNSFQPPTGTSEVPPLIKKRPNLEVQNKYGVTLMQCALNSGMVDVVKELFRAGAKYPSEMPSYCSPPEGSEMHALLGTVRSFFDSVKAGDNDKVLNITSKEACVVGARDDHGYTALHWAALGNHVSILKVLLELGCDPTVVSDKGNSPLHIAASKGHVDVAETLLRAMGPDRMTTLLDGRTGKGGNTPLHAAAEKGHEGMVRTLLAHGAAYCSANSAGRTPVDLCKDTDCRNLFMLVEKLFSGLIKGEFESVDRMLEEVDAKDVLAVFGARNDEQKTLVQVATKHKYQDFAKTMVKLLRKDVDM